MCKQLIQVQANMFAGATVDESADKSAGVSVNVRNVTATASAGARAHTQNELASDCSNS
jgi:hypothetical protein